MPEISAHLAPGAQRAGSAWLRKEKNAWAQSPTLRSFACTEPDGRFRCKAPAAERPGKTGRWHPMTFRTGSALKQKPNSRWPSLSATQSSFVAGSLSGEIAAALGSG